MTIEELQGCGQGGANYPIDIVLCLDVTGSMQGCIDNAKKMALGFKDDFLGKMKELGKNCTGGIRVKVIAFRDLTMGEKMEITPFFKMPDQEEELKEFINGLEAQGGGPEPESSYEALIEAFHSDWVKEGAKRRWVTALFTDASAHPEKLNDLVEAWNSLAPAFKRLLLFAPDHPTWTDFAGQASNTTYYQSKAGEGLEEHDKDAILSAIAGSI